MLKLGLATVVAIMFYIAATSIVAAQPRELSQMEATATLTGQQCTPATAGATYPQCECFLFPGQFCTTCQGPYSITLPDGSTLTYYRKCEKNANNVDTQMHYCGASTPQSSCTYRYAGDRCGAEKWFSGAGCTGGIGGLDSCTKIDC